MSADERAADPGGAVFRRTMAGIVLATLGLLLWALYRFAANGEAHSYTPGDPPPNAVTLSSGQKYWLAVHGGVRALPGDVPVSALACHADAGGASTPLQLTTEDPTDTKATDAIASFVSPVSGPARVTCTGLSAVYVDNASGDPSGWLLVGGTVLLTIGVPLLISAVRSNWLLRPPPPVAPIPPPIDVR